MRATIALMDVGTTNAMRASPHNTTADKQDLNKIQAKISLVHRKWNSSVL
jgi:hypothetical protein